MKNIIFILIVFYLASCNGSSNKSAGQLWEDGQNHRTQNQLKESITSFKAVLEKYPTDDFAAKAQFQIADIYLNDVKDFEYAVKEFQKVVDNYPNQQVAKKSLFMIGYIYNNYLDAYTDAIITYKLFAEKYPTDELMPSVKYELDGLNNIKSTIDSLNSIVNKKLNS